MRDVDCQLQLTDFAILLGGKLQIVKKESIRTALHNGTFFSTIWLVVVDGGAKIRSPKKYVECLNSVSSDTNERRIFLEMVLERTTQGFWKGIYVGIPQTIKKKKIKTEIEGISASFSLFPLGNLYVCNKRWLSSYVHEWKCSKYIKLSRIVKGMILKMLSGVLKGFSFVFWRIR